jgi:hypothetical protein
MMADKNFFPAPEVQKKLVPDLPESDVFRRRLMRTWAHFRTGQ